jgi:cytochrome c oxidase cbb3-type subunit 2
MPAFPWLNEAKIDGAVLQNHMRALRKVGVPYTDAEIDAAPKAVEGKTEMDAVIAHLQGLGLALKNK